MDAGGGYARCSACGHEIHIGPISDSFIINDSLSKKEIAKKNGLDRFKEKIVANSALNRDFLLDVGSAGGKFLFYEKSKFKDYAGIEVTEESLNFSKKELGLKIFKNISELKGVDNFSIVTFWHSLEHIPVRFQDEIFKFLHVKANKDTRIIVSVPNADSLLYKICGGKYAYFDPESHIHQFTPASLDGLLGKYNFFPQKNFFSFSYSFFGYLQTLLNFGNIRHNFLYYCLKRKRNFGLGKGKIFLLFSYNIFLTIIFFLPALICSVFDFIEKNKGAVLTVCYRNQPST